MGRQVFQISKIIKDPVYKYISVYENELKIIDSRIFQRLRGIKQNATAYLTYPSAVGSRFEHSLGTMHLAGEMVKSGIEKSNTTLVEEFINECRIQFNDLNKSINASIDIRKKIFHVVRLAGLLHDVGHVPFSHALEELICENIEQIYGSEESKKWEYFQRKYEGSFHEFLGMEIIKEDKTVREALGKDIEIVLRVLKPCRNERSVFKTLHEIISSEIDADRGDYLIRDGQMSGADFGNFDINRLVESLQLRKRKQDFIIRPTMRALSAIESLLLERYKFYKWFWSHHRVVSTNLILNEIILRLLNARFKKRAPFGDLLRFPDCYYETADADLIPQNHPIFWDDLSVMHMLREMYTIVLESLSSGNYGDYEKEDFDEMRVLLEEILFRGKRALSLWKYPKSFEEDFDTPSKPEIEKVINKVRKRWYIKQKGVKLPSRGHMQFRKEEFASNWLIRNCLNNLKNKKILEKKINERLIKENFNCFVLLGVDFFKLYEYTEVNEYVLFGKELDEIYYASDVSELIRQLDVVKERDILLHGCLVPKDIREATEKQLKGNLGTVKKIMRESLIEWLDKYPMLEEVIPQD